MKPEELEFLSERKFTRDEIAAFYEHPIRSIVQPCSCWPCRAWRSSTWQRVFVSIAAGLFVLAVAYVVIFELLIERMVP